ncbi:hypothetical protein NIM87_15090 [Devosia sp. XJ19-1]|uniref:Uncharacterized protein n=1 Tax=Devosia ureilytica TaxID=2952754 RepID=A0A9Q4ARU6_9HYPH|nr:hypothetical protein [Devosia ureilytica]MCP8884833.1 hypothetical protein [Devosia ureilytica]MCP8888656.1 hypothetical protein [Devosia ureilytica]
MINPALHAFPSEASLIGQMVVGYGEIDISMVSAVGKAMGMMFQLLDALEEVQSEMRRIVVVQKLARGKFVALGLADEFDQAISAMEFCRETRNYFAHCHYGDFGDGVLVTVKAKDMFAMPGSIDDLNWRRHTVETLTALEQYFTHCRAYWLWLDQKITHPDHFSILWPGAVARPPRDGGRWERQSRKREASMVRVPSGE